MTARTCLECERSLIPHNQWFKMTTDERAAAKAVGRGRHCARNLCVRCYNRAYKASRLDDYERVTMPSDVVVDEFKHLFGTVTDLSQKRRAELAAEQMGMTFEALERAVVRANRRVS